MGFGRPLMDRWALLGHSSFLGVQVKSNGKFFQRKVMEKPTRRPVTLVLPHAACCGFPRKKLDGCGSPTFTLFELKNMIIYFGYFDFKSAYTINILFYKTRSMYVLKYFFYKISISIECAVATYMLSV